MNRDSADARPLYFWPLIALLAGVLLGLIIGWGIWPVKWTNAYPQDLRAAERNDYLAMVAESYAANPDLGLAQQRLAGWSGEELAELLADVQAAAVDTDAKRAAAVQALSSALGLAAAPAQPGAATPDPAADAAAPPAALAVLRTICTAVLWLLLAAAAVALFIFLFRLWQKYQRGTAERSASEQRQPFGRGVDQATRTTTDITDEVKSQWPEERDAFAEVTAAPVRGRSSSYTREPVPREEEPLDSDLPPFMAQRDEPGPVVRSEPVGLRREPPPELPKRAPAPAATPALARLGDFTAIYQGESDYDEAFDINDPVDGYMGQCGLQLNDPVGRSRDQAVALQVWLWDSSDPDTRVKVLMSENAYRDTSLRSEQAGEHEALPVRPGAEFTLETHDLLLQGRVERVEYTEQEPYRSIFSEFQVKLQALRKS